MLHRSKALGAAVSQPALCSVFSLMCPDEDCSLNPDEEWGRHQLSGTLLTPDPGKAFVAVTGIVLTATALT